MKKLIFINSHPIQYFAPMYKYMSERRILLTAWYASTGVLYGGFDKEFGITIKWDIPLLEGYDNIVFTNNSWKPSHETGFWGLINLSMIAKLFMIPKSVVVVHGWHYFTHLAIILLGRLAGHIVCVRNETPYRQEVLKTGWKQRTKRFFRKNILFPRIDYFLFIGNQNRLFYQSYGISNEQLVYCPYVVDNERFSGKSLDKNALKAKFRIPITDKVILYSGKYIDKKRPIDLLQAFDKLKADNCWLVMVGDGHLRKHMEDYIDNRHLKQVILTGFINQSTIAEYYSICDVFVMCSSAGETWGLSVNEAMNFNVPVVISDMTGCSDDLVADGSNGYVFRTSDVIDLTAKLEQVLLSNELSWQPDSKAIIASYSYSTVLDNLLSIPELNGKLVR